MQLPHDAEADAIALALIASVTIGAAIIVAKLIKFALRERARDAKSQELFNLQTGLHPADDLDDWETLSDWQRSNPEQADQYLRDAMSHRGKGKHSN